MRRLWLHAYRLPALQDGPGSQVPVTPLTWLWKGNYHDNECVQNASLCRVADGRGRGRLLRTSTSIHENFEALHRCQPKKLPGLQLVRWEKARTLTMQFLA